MKTFIFGLLMAFLAGYSFGDLHGYTEGLQDSGVSVQK